MVTVSFRGDPLPRQGGHQRSPAEQRPAIHACSACASEPPVITRRLALSMCGCRFWVGLVHESLDRPDAAHLPRRRVNPQHYA
jgi:hypothetical protein